MPPPIDLDLAIRGGTVVTAEGRAAVDIGIRGSSVVAVGDRVGDAANEIDATGLLVLPGGVDMHVHFTPSARPDRPPTWLDDFESGSRAAVVGGITTIGNMSSPRRGESFVDLVRRHRDEAAAASLVDFALHPVLTDAEPERLTDLERLGSSGPLAVKFFMMHEAFDANVPGYVRAMAFARDHGLLTLIHCEDGPLIRQAADALVAAGQGSLAHYAESRPVEAELAAVVRAIAMCAVTGCPTYLVHVSSRRAVEAICDGRTRELQLYAETRPLYLHHTRAALDGKDGPLFVGSPPLRGEDDQEALWTGLRDGDIDTLCSDHVAWSRNDKLNPIRDVRTSLPGVPEIETMLPLLFSEGVRTGRLPLERFVAITATNAAKAFGIYPRKGTISVGSDADIGIWDPDRVRTIRASEAASRADFSPYEGRSVQGWPRHVISRGEMVLEDGRITGQPGRGLYLTRSGTDT